MSFRYAAMSLPLAIRQLTHGPRLAQSYFLRLHESLYPSRHMSGKHRIARIKRVFEANIAKLNP
jgi:hypothetical protein